MAKLRNLEDDIVCEPVWPNEGVYEWYALQLQTFLTYANAEIQSNIALDYSRGENTIGYAADAPSRVSLVQRTLDKWAKKWTKTYDAMADEIANNFATRNRNATDQGVMRSFAKAGFTVKFKLTRGMRDSYKAVVQTNVELIRSIPAQYLKDVRTAVWTNLTTGGGDMEALRVKIQDAYGVADRRAAFIARDQTNKAKAVFEEARRDELGIEEAEWQHSSAGKEPRPTHVKAGAARTRYNIKLGWLDPATGKRIWPGTEINCKCTSRSVIPGMRRKKYYPKV